MTHITFHDKDDNILENPPEGYAYNPATKKWDGTSNPIHQFNEREEKTMNEEIASLLVASSLFHSQISDKGGKTINFAVFQEHLSKEIDEFKSHLHASNTRAMQFVLDRVREGVGEVHKPTHAGECIANMHGDLYCDCVQFAIEGGINAEKAKTRQLLDDLSALMEQK